MACRDCSRCQNCNLQQGRCSENGRNQCCSNGSVTVGTTTTGDAGTKDRVGNSGTSANTEFDFVTSNRKSRTDIVKAANEDRQSSEEGEALEFELTPISSGRAISHENGSSDIVIGKEGIYVAVFNGIVFPGDEAMLPENLTLRIYVDDEAVSGGAAVHYFTICEERASMTITVFFEIEDTPATVQVRAENDGFDIEDAALTVLKVGKRNEG